MHAEIPQRKKHEIMKADCVIIDTLAQFCRRLDVKPFGNGVNLYPDGGDEDGNLMMRGTFMTGGSEVKFLICLYKDNREWKPYLMAIRFPADFLSGLTPSMPGLKSPESRFDIAAGNNGEYEFKPRVEEKFVPLDRI